MNQNPLFSIQGFDYILKQIYTPRISKQNLNDLLESLYSPQSQLPPNPQQPISSKRKQAKKAIQYQGVLELIKTLKIPENILELGCGDGNLCKLLAQTYSAKITGIDEKKELIEKINQQTLPPNLEFINTNAFEYQPPSSPGLVISLHGCGNLTDRTIDLAIAHNSAIICVPCCYGKINQHQELLPRSTALSARKIEFQKLLTRTTSLEGYADYREDSQPTILSGLCKKLIDFDRIFYLQEHGYNAFFTRITSDKLKNIPTSPLNTAIVGTINQ